MRYYMHDCCIYSFPFLDMLCHKYSYFLIESFCIFIKFKEIGKRNYCRRFVKLFLKYFQVVLKIVNHLLNIFSSILKGRSLIQ